MDPSANFASRSGAVVCPVHEKRVAVVAGDLVIMAKDTGFVVDGPDDGAWGVSARTIAAAESVNHRRPARS